MFSTEFKAKLARLVAEYNLEKIGFSLSTVPVPMRDAVILKAEDIVGQIQSVLTANNMKIVSTLKEDQEELPEKRHLVEALSIIEELLNAVEHKDLNQYIEKPYERAAKFTGKIASSETGEVGKTPINPFRLSRLASISDEVEDNPQPNP